MQQGDEISKNIEAYLAIKRLLSCQKLFPGQKIIYRDMEEILGMSKTPIINALMKLEQEGLVVSKRHRGFYVRDVTAEDIHQVFHLREKLEEVALDLAVPNHTDADLKVLKEKLDDYLEYSFQFYDRQRAELDIDFHMQIAIMGKNRFFASIIRQFYEQIYFKINFLFLTPYIEMFKEQHKLLFDAIKSRDLEQSKEIIRLHNEVGTRVTLEILNRYKETEHEQ